MITKRHLMIFLLILVVLTIGGLVALLQIQHLSLDSSIQRSVFVDDICNPPCWFGLTAGTSSVADVNAMLERFDALFYRWSTAYPSNVFDPQTEQLIDGTYHLYWQTLEREDLYASESYIGVDSGVVTLLKIQMNRFVPLSQALEYLGEPDFVRFSASHYGGLDLVYLTSNLRVSLVSYLNRECNLANIEDNFWVDFVYYFSPTYQPEIAGELSLVSQIGHERIVPMETWHSWLNGEVTASCLDAYDSLPDDFELPIVATEEGD